MLIFVPADDVNASAAAAQGFANIEIGPTFGPGINLEFILLGEFKTFSFRLGNDGPDAVDWSLISPDANLTIDTMSGHLEPDECSDTITAVVDLPLDLSSRTVFTPIMSNTGTGIMVRYDVVPANENREPEFPSRASPITEQASEQIKRAGEVIRLYRFDGIPWNPDDRRILGWSRLGLTKPFGTMADFTNQNAQRLNLGNRIWGFSRTSFEIIGSFQGEQDSSRFSFQTENADDDFSGQARLIVPAEYDLSRTWALKYPQTELEPARYARTVYLIKHQGDILCLWQIYARTRGNEFSHWECELRKVHNRTMGSTSEFVPSSFLFEYQNDKPYSYTGHYLDDGYLDDEDPYA